MNSKQLPLCLGRLISYIPHVLRVGVTMDVFSVWTWHCADYDVPANAAIGFLSRCGVKYIQLKIVATNTIFVVTSQSRLTFCNSTLQTWKGQEKPQCDASCLLGHALVIPVVPLLTSCPRGTAAGATPSLPTTLGIESL